MFTLAGSVMISWSLELGFFYKSKLHKHRNKSESIERSQSPNLQQNEERKSKDLNDDMTQGAFHQFLAISPFLKRGRVENVGRRVERVEVSSFR